MGVSPTDLIHDEEPLGRACERPEHSALFVSGARAVGIRRGQETHHLRDGAGLQGRVQEHLTQMVGDGVSHPVAIGALPFATDGRVSVMLGSAAGVPDAAPASEPHAGLSDLREYAVRMEPTLAGYVAQVEAALGRIARGELTKVVLGRCITFHLSQGIPLGPVIARLRADPRPGFTFAIDAGEFGGAKSTLVGKSPELLLRKKAGVVESFPLAGSVPRVADKLEDERRSQALLRSDKDRFEHALVVDQIADLLAPYCWELDVPSTPELVRTPSMWHLGTHIRGRLRDRRHSALSLARMLHPTPALCGVPTATAQAAIAELEPFDRGLFGGLVGYCDAHGDGEWAVTIRCAQVADQRVRLFAGAGIVAASNPLLELQETRAKLDTMLAVLGLKSALEVA